MFIFAQYVYSIFLSLLGLFAMKLTKKQLRDAEEHLNWLNNKGKDDRCNHLLSQIKAGDIKIVPSWHLNESDIDFSFQGGLSSILKNGWELHIEIDVQTLTDNLAHKNDTFFRSKDIDYDWHTTCKVAEHWVKGKKLIPPILQWLSHSQKIDIVDGKHRFKLVHYFDIKKIPVIMPKIQSEQILMCLNNGQL